MSKRIPSRRVCACVVMAYSFTPEHFQAALARNVPSSRTRRTIRLAIAVVCMLQAIRREVFKHCSYTRELLKDRRQ